MVHRNQHRGGGVTTGPNKDLAVLTCHLRVKGLTIETADWQGDKLIYFLPTTGVWIVAFPLVCLTPCTSSCGPPHLFRPILGKMSSFVSSATTKLAYSKGSHQGENLPRKRISRLGISSLSPTARKIAAAAQAKRTTTPSKSMRSLAKSNSYLLLSTTDAIQKPLSIEAFTPSH